MCAAPASSLAVNGRPSSSADSIVARAGSPTSAAVSAMMEPVIIELLGSPRWIRRRRQLVGVAAGPVVLGHARPHPIAAGLQGLQDGRLVRSEHTPAVHHEPTIDVHAIDILIGCVVDDVLDGVA